MKDYLEGVKPGVLKTLLHEFSKRSVQSGTMNPTIEILGNKLRVKQGEVKGNNDNHNNKDRFNRQNTG